jgi:hypothetical protein
VKLKYKFFLRDIIILFIFFYIISLLLIFKNPRFNLGLNSTSSNYYLITINIIILFNAQTYKLQHDAFFYHLFELNSKFCVCSCYDEYMTHNIRRFTISSSYTFFWVLHPPSPHNVGLFPTCECPTSTLIIKIVDGVLLWQTHHTTITSSLSAAIGKMHKNLAFSREKLFYHNKNIHHM